MDRLYHDPALARFYDWDCPWTGDHDWFASLVRGSVLDLGCGTGMFAAAMALRGHRVTGVDPARPMLDIARGRVGGRAVSWVEADARGLDLGQRFDTVLMIGHAYQTLLTQGDRVSVLPSIARHLAPGGRFFFDSRNPEARISFRSAGWRKAFSLFPWPLAPSIAAAVSKNRESKSWPMSSLSVPSGAMRARASLSTGCLNAPT